MTIGAAGGQQSCHWVSEVTLTVPAGALVQDTDITAHATNNRDGVSSLITFGPSGLIFESQRRFVSMRCFRSSGMSRLSIWWYGRTIPIPTTPLPGGGIEVKSLTFHLWCDGPN